MLTRTTIVLAVLAKPFVCNPQPTPAVTGDESSSSDSSGSTEPTGSSTSPTETVTDPSSTTTTTDPMCGNGVPEDGEECDDGNQDQTDACLNNCKNASCGDDLVWTDEEECDDGDQLDTNACTAACKNAKCGDSIVWEGKEECDDGNDVNDDDCTNDCKKPVCGDGMKTGTEECDDGANNVPKEQATAEQCTTECKIACADGTQSAMEECDDGNLEANDGCSPSCTDEYIMFVTAESYPVDFGGVAGADVLCQTAATGKFTGTYVAWLSAGEDSASSDIPVGKPMIRPDGMLIVASAEDLIKGPVNTSLMNTIELDVDGNPVTGYAWTGTTSSGTPSGADCTGWTIAEQVLADVGDLKSLMASWTKASAVMPLSQATCEATNHLYCFRKLDL